MKLGQKAMELLKEEVTGRLLREGDELVAAGDTALMGTSLLVQKEKKVLQQFFSEGFLWDAWEGTWRYGAYSIPGTLEEFLDACGEENRKDWTANIIKLSEWEALKHAGAETMYPLNFGGVLAGLWKLAEASEAGLHADLRKIPVRQETIEICERFDLNPYKLFSGGSLLLGTRKGDAVVRFFQEKGIPAAVIGSVDRGNDRLLYSGEHTRYLERPSQDELTRFPWGNPWKYSGRLPGGKEEPIEC